MGSAFQRIMDHVIDLHNLKGTFAYLDNITIVGKDQKEHDENFNSFIKVAEKLKLTFNENKFVISLKKINLLGYTVSNGCRKV